MGLESHELMHSWENEERSLTLISLCSRNCMMTFRRYSRLTSSSDLTMEGELGLEGAS